MTRLAVSHPYLNSSKCNLESDLKINLRMTVKLKFKIKSRLASPWALARDGCVLSLKRVFIQKRIAWTNDMRSDRGVYWHVFYFCFVRTSKENCAWLCSKGYFFFHVGRKPLLLCWFLQSSFFASVWQFFNKVGSHQSIILSVNRHSEDPLYYTK